MTVSETFTARRWTLAKRPEGIPTADCFALAENDIGPVQDGWAIAEMSHISIDPGMRSRLSGDSYAAVMEIGETIESAGIGHIVATGSDKLAVGDLVMTGSGWTSHAHLPAKAFVKLDPSLFQAPLTQTAAIGILGIPGMTAYFGLLDLGAPEKGGAMKEGETVLVSSAAGTVGAATGQIAKIKGLRAVGIAGSKEKCDWLLSIGFDAAINYKDAAPLKDQINAACPHGVDIYLDNVGGEMLDTAISCMNQNGRLIISGAVSEYNRAEPVGIRNTLDFISKRLRMEGLVVFDYARQFPKAQMDMAGWIMSGALTYREEIIDGLENAPTAFAALFDGSPVFGRRIVKV